MAHAIAARTPAHLWIVGVLSLLWNSIGGYDYTMTRLRNADYLSQMGDSGEILAYIDAMPFYAQIGWGVGVWGALLGAVLLLMRSRFAVHAFAASLAGALISLGAQYLGAPMPASMDSGMARYMPIAIILLAAAQLWYAMRAAKAGALR